MQDFNQYYNSLGKDCPDNEALSTRLRKAIDNSKAKKYHGSSEHMNELPALSDQARTMLLAEPSPFLNYDEAKNAIAAGNEKEWKAACCAKFAWVGQAISNNWSAYTPSELAKMSDDHNIERSVLHPKDLDKL